MEGFSTFVINTAFFRMDDGHNHPASNQPKRLKKVWNQPGVDWEIVVPFPFKEWRNFCKHRISAWLFPSTYLWVSFFLMKCFASCAAGTLRDTNGLRFPRRFRWNNSQPYEISRMWQGLNSHDFHIIGDGHQPNSTGRVYDIRIPYWG